MPRRDMKEETKALSAALVECGIPERAIDIESNVRLPDGWILRADLVVVAADGKTPLAVFEIKVACTLEKVYERAKEELARLKCLVAKGIKVFVVAPAADGKLHFVQLANDGWRDSQWRPLADLRTEFGNYVTLSSRIVERANFREARQAQFRQRVVCVGAVLLAGLMVAEILGKEFSWKIYSLIGLVSMLYAVSCRYSVKICLGGNEFSLVPKDSRGGEA